MARRRLFLALAASLSLGAEAPSLSDLDGRNIDPLDRKDVEATVFVFVRTDCPVSNRYAPEVRRLRESFERRGIAFWLVFVDPGESSEAIRAHLREYEYGVEALRDSHHRLVELAGARVTPEAAVFSRDRELLYRGRIDDRYSDFGQARPRATSRDLERALVAILSGEKPTFATTDAVGCYISDLR
jgi:hypothetical protein